MLIKTKSISRRTFLKATAAIPLLSLAVAPFTNQPTAQAAQRTATDGYGFGTYNEGSYPAPQQTIYLPLITKGD